MQILLEIAEYIPPGIHSGSGTFKLRPEMAAKFDPFSLHLDPITLSQTYESAEQAGWDPTTMLTQLPPPPLGLENLYHALGGEVLLRCIASSTILEF